MEYVYIGVIIACVAAMVGLSYYFYRKLSAQQNSIDELIKKYRVIENIFTRPPPEKEAARVVSKKADKKCEGCDIEPISELSELIEEENVSP